MTKKEEQLLREREEIIGFLVHRMVNRSSGISSNAMLAEAIAAHPVDEDDYPWDLDDLSRCFRTWLEAPGVLRAKMLWRLAQYTSHVSEKHISVDGVKDRA